MKNLLFVTTLLVASLIGCAKSTDPAGGSQTHFLETCDESCAAPYACICGVCTIECSEDAMCGAHAEAAQCVAPASASCSDLASVCDVSCEDDDECAALGETFECREGRCREDAITVPADGGVDADTPNQERGALCDGSRDMRLGYTSEGGQVETTYELTNPYGHAFLFVDGQCNYFVSTDYREGLYSGALRPDQRDALARMIEWDAIDELAAETDDESCDDAGETTIWAPGAKVACTCGCAETAVGARKAAALQYVSELMTTLMVQGDHYFSPVLALASPTIDISAATPWLLDRAITAVPGLVQDVSMEGVGAFAIFDREVDVQALHQLRVNRQSGPTMVVVDAGVTYELYLRDAFPPGVQDRIDALRGIDTPIDNEMGELCDGSDDIRLALLKPRDQGRSFIHVTQPYHASGFFYVDGHCNYYDSRDYVQGIATGKLNPSDVESLQSAFHWQSLGHINLEPDVGSDCPDFVGLTVATQRAFIGCDCECDGPNGELLTTALDQADYWITSALYPTSNGLDTPVRAIATLIDGEPAGTTLAWPLDRPIADYEGLVSEDGATGAGVLFDDPDDAAALRDVRNSQSIDEYGLTIQDGEAVYVIHIVDQLPADIASAVDRFFAVP